MDKLTIKQLSEHLGLTPQEMADRIGYKNWQTAYSMEHKAHQWSRKTLRKWIKATGGRMVVMAVYDNEEIEIVEVQE